MDKRTAKVRYLEAKRDLAQAELDAEVAKIATKGFALVLRHPDGRAIKLGPDAVVLRPGNVFIFRGGKPDEMRVTHDPEALRACIEEVIADPQFGIRPSSNPSTPPG